MAKPSEDITATELKPYVNDQFIIKIKSYSLEGSPSTVVYHESEMSRDK